MDQILNFMKQGKSLRVLDRQFLETENAQIPDFVTLQAFAPKRAEIKAKDGSVYSFCGLPFYRGNYIWVKLCDDDAVHQNNRFIRLGEMFDQNTVVVIAVDGDKVCSFAPVAENKKMLERFLSDIRRYIDKYQALFSWDAYNNFCELAEWLYEHNPHKMCESDRQC